jgi:hypothetical protein
MGLGEPRDLRGAQRALQVARVDGGEVDAAQALTQPAGLLLALGQQRQIGSAGVLAVLGPGRFAVPNEIQV